MKLNKLAFSLALATLGFVSVPAAAQAFTLSSSPSFTDTEFINLLNTGEFTELFVAESRIGNNANNGDRELGINNAAFAPVAQGHRTWQSGTPVDFILEYTGNLVNYIVGGQTLSSTAFSGPVTDIFLRTRAATRKDAQGNITAQSSMELTNLLLNGKSLGSLLSSTYDSLLNSDIDYLRVSGLTGPFTLTGTSIMTWTGTRPTGSNLAYQIKVGTSPETESVPEPGMVLALSLGAGAIATRKRKQSQTAS
ncbi:PEP-CTERM sorting domain-containing protein [Desertifilum sp. FACHB-1129]|uniref:PEP-CTERM protein-sorting domain-containing protein n=1 Tax=Desertifilum tharense IPPAS B-1220 TaxID=1781255 RepID=A0A1E5QIE6_9CYAN|nr:MULTISPECIES: PEP-CTERM sorting domain-containing protein [Desertifilum]MBD2312577.1 PEP-CTERM sorting domain-containing protein [Desertifilum sp. FACHB-1129]MBD2320523.1 PEP-CTERM sorting domain-containing protein [Desertifilum sp. FACHB-866]MBD2330651.1 PEP-CTERM sorting domain-containing protein [Desertifilum sp. FACHB-868]OEJ74449.1 hypothetical protein BH720_14595 [Desertifilum tharense IPPAS B-1220]